MNPYSMLAIVFLCLGLFGSGVSIGVKWERNDTLARIAVAQDTAIKAANAGVALETERVLTRAKAEADARARYREVKYKGELDAIKKSRPECQRDGESLGLLRDAIREANGDKGSSATTVPEPVRADGGAFGWLGAIGSKLGVSSGGAVRSVPATP